MSILPYLSDTGAMYLEYLTEDTFKSIFPNPAVKGFNLLNVLLTAGDLDLDLLIDLDQLNDLDLFMIVI